MPASRDGPFGSGTVTRSNPAERAGAAASISDPSAAKATFMAFLPMATMPMLTPLTLRPNVSCVNISLMTRDSAYHHGDLRAALMRAAGGEIERGGYENLSLREVAASLGVSRAAPYRHFVDRRALLAAL